MKKRNKHLIFVMTFLFLSFFISGGMPIISNAFTFPGTSILRLSDTINIKSPINGKTYTPYMKAEGYYPATFGFENDEVGDDPDGWTVNEVAGTVNVKSEYNGHKKVVDLHKTSSGSGKTCYMTHTFTDQTDGTIEFWWAVNTFTSPAYVRQYFQIWDDSALIVELRIYQDRWLSYRDSTGRHNLFQWTAAEWFHVSVRFDCSINTYYLAIHDSVGNFKGGDGGTGYSFIQSTGSIDTVQFASGAYVDEWHHYVDAIGYDWVEPYKPGDNKPIQGYYPATYGFENDQVDSDPIGWDLIENAGSIKVINELEGHNRVVELYKNGVTDNLLMENGIDNIVSGTIEFWWRVSSKYIRTHFEVYENGNRQIHIRFYNTGQLQVRDGSSYYDVFSYSADTWYHFSVEFDCASDWHLSVHDEEGIYRGGDNGNGFSFQGNPTNMDKVRFSNGKYMYNWYSYVDAISYDWVEPYKAGDNRHEGLLIDLENDDLGNMEYTLTTNGVPSGPFSILGNTVIKFPDNGEHTITVTSPSHDSGSVSFTTKSIEIYSPIENENYKSPMPGYYPATFGFENHEPGTVGTDIDFIDEYSGSRDYAYIKIGDELNGHKNYLILKDAQLYFHVWGVHYIDNPTESGTVEWYWSQNHFDPNVGSSEKKHYLNFRKPDNSIAFQIRTDINYDKYEYNDGGTWHELITLNPDSWYHHKITFDCQTGKYSWTVSQVDGTGFAMVSDKNFQNSATTINSLEIRADAWRGTSYWDAFGFSWEDNYDVGDNLEEGLLLSYNPDIDNDNIDDLEWIAYTHNDGILIPFDDVRVIPLNRWYTNSIQLIGKVFAGGLYSSKKIFYTFISPPLVGSRDRNFPQEQVKRLGYSFYMAFSYTPQIQFRISEIGLDDIIDIKIYIDPIFVDQAPYWATRIDINSQYTSNIIDTPLLKEHLTHTIVIEIENSDNSLYKLEFLNILGGIFTDSINYKDQKIDPFGDDIGLDYYSPAQIHFLGEEYNNLLVIFGSDIPIANKDLEYNGNQPKFKPSLSIQMDPEIEEEIHNEELAAEWDILYEEQYNLYSMDIQMKLVDNEGNYVSGDEIDPENGALVDPGYGVDIKMEDDVNGEEDDVYQYALALLIDMLEAIPFVGEFFEFLDILMNILGLFSSFIEMVFPGGGGIYPEISQDFTDPLVEDTYQVSWKAGTRYLSYTSYPYLYYGGYGSYCDNSLQAVWNTFLPAILGDIQIQFIYNVKIKLAWEGLKRDPNPFNPYGIHGCGFSEPHEINLSGEHFINFKLI
ncbi:MAG: hypothetical protein ACFE9Z_05565 [Promethearchaeota archaeon]